MNWSYLQPSSFNPNKSNPNLPLSDNLNKLNKLNKSESSNFDLAQKIANMTYSQNLKSLLHSY